jgi:hypothetical protein
MSGPITPNDEEWVYEDDEVEDEELYLEEDCGMGPDGQCGYAGSEFCDWDCPMERQTWKRNRLTGS